MKLIKKSKFTTLDSKSLSRLIEMNDIINKIYLNRKISSSIYIELSDNE